MATVIFVDQENGDVASTILSKDHVKQARSAKPLFKTQAGKVFGSVTSVKPRKALGNVNKQVVQTAIPQQKVGIKVKKSAPVAKQISETCVKPSKQIYPEIEKCLPYDPADFETFDVPEEHKLSHLFLAGVPLMVHENEAAKFNSLANQEPAPMDIPGFSWESDVLCTIPSFMETLEEITLDLPKW